MFCGESILNLDVKGRLAMPSRYREELASTCDGRLVITVGLAAACLWVYARPTFEQVIENLTATPGLDKRATGLKRLLIGHACEPELDKHGRVLVPPNLRAHAALDKRVALVGQGNKFELWDEQAWINERDGLLESADELLDGSDSGALSELVL